MTRVGLILPVTLMVVGTGGCSGSSDPAEPREEAMAPVDEALYVSIEAEATEVTLGERVRFDVSAENVGSSPVQWGPGSSSCQLELRVRVDGEDRFAAVGPSGGGPCTMDLSVHTLEPGESRTETVSWDGRAQPEPGERLEELAPGTYEVRGFARPVATSEPISITVVED